MNPNQENFADEINDADIDTVAQFMLAVVMLMNEDDEYEEILSEIFDVTDYEYDGSYIVGFGNCAITYEELTEMMESVYDWAESTGKSYLDVHGNAPHLCELFVGAVESGEVDKLKAYIDGELED